MFSDGSIKFINSILAICSHQVPFFHFPCCCCSVVLLVSSRTTAAVGLKKQDLQKVLIFEIQHSIQAKPVNLLLFSLTIDYIKYTLIRLVKLNYDYLYSLPVFNRPFFPPFTPFYQSLVLSIIVAKLFLRYCCDLILEIYCIVDM